MLSSWLLLAPAVPAAAALGTALARPRGHARSLSWGSASRLVPAATTLAGLATLVLAAIVWIGGETPSIGIGGTPLLIATPLTTLLLGLVLGLSWVIQRFSQRFLYGDGRQDQFFVLSGALTLATSVVATSATLLGLAVAWTATTILVCLLVGLYRHWAHADEGVRRTAIALGTGDLALWIAVGLLTSAHGTITLHTEGAQIPALDGAQGVLIGLLLVVAAAARSAQVPFHHWLPATLASPTPVSALLHAGVINGGGVLLIALSPLVSQHQAVMITMALLGAATTIVGTLLMLTRPDRKGALAQSTVAQMGFMIATCGLGAWTAALLHLVAHGWYKASRFLSAGEAVEQVAQPHGAQHGSPTTAVALAAVAAAPFLAAAAVTEPSGATLVLMLFAWLTLASAARGWAETARTGTVAIVGAIGAAAAGALYLASTTELKSVLEPAGTLGTAAPAWVLLPLALILVALPLLIARGPQGLTDRLYAWALTSGDGSRPPLRRRGNPEPLFPVDLEALRS